MDSALDDPGPLGGALKGVDQRTTGLEARRGARQAAGRGRGRRDAAAVEEAVDQLSLA